jgi:hypothetical protein
MTRPKGWAEWNPREETLVVVRDVRSILNEYAHYGPMTARQIFYRMVGQYGYDKTEKAYKRLCEYLVRARRAGLIPFSSIRDDGTIQEGGGGWHSPTSFWNTVDRIAEDYERDRLQNQEAEIELWCEAAGMVPMLVNMTEEWHIPIFSTGGFSSVTVTYEAAQRIARRSKPTIFLHIGDYDPSGESIFESMSQDIGAFVAGELGLRYDRYSGEVEDKFTPRRVALTEDQVDEHDLPTAPPKSSDSRSAKWIGDTTQAEALPPTLLDEIVKDAITDYIDEDKLDEIKKQSREERELILEKLEEAKAAFPDDEDDEDY